MFGELKNDLMEIKKWTGEKKIMPLNADIEKVFEKFMRYVRSIKVIELSNGRVILGFVKHEVIPDMKEYLVETMYSMKLVKEIDTDKNENSQFYLICEVSKIFIPSKAECVVPHIEGEYRKINKDHIVSMDYPPIDKLREITFH